MSVRVTGTLTITFGSTEEMVRVGEQVQENLYITMISVDQDNLTATAQLDLTTEV